MENIFTSVCQMIGNTPLLELTSLTARFGLKARLLAKLECQNPAGSVKDRAALYMIEDAQRRGILKNGSVIIEPTSGNTGIGLACVAASRGYRCLIVMPDSMSMERQLLMGAYGAEVVLTPGALGMQGAINKAQQLAKQIPDSFIADQFNNPANVDAHFMTTGPEIWKDTCGKIDVFVCGVGTGGTITGVGRYLKQQDPSIKVVAVEPASSALLSGGKAGNHGLQGIGANFIPGILDTSLLDEIVPVSEADAYRASRELASGEGILVGISSGAALHAAILQARREENTGKTIVALLPDTGTRYLSTSLFGGEG